tara:strand:+ start:56 stop:688 length:633 start_codon:yes stop_codon:yes gene_type:complete
MSGPKKSEYKATEAEKIQAKVAKAEKDYFNEKYNPLLREMRDLSMKENYGGFAAGRAQADTMQALTKPSLAATRSVDASADLASAAGAQQIMAQGKGLAAKRQRQVGVLATARGQQADATTGLASIARLEASDRLQSAQRKQMMRNARTNAAMELGGTLFSQGMDNLDQGSGFFGREAREALKAKEPKKSLFRIGMSRLGDKLAEEMGGT